MFFSSLFSNSEFIGNRLQNLKDYLPGCPPYIYEFARFLGERPGMRDRLTPFRFVCEAKLAAFDLARGQDGYTGQEIKHQLVGCNPDALVGTIVLIGSAAFSKGSLVRQVERLFLSHPFLSHFPYSAYIKTG